MCGIIAYLGNKDCFNILIKALKLLEYRGYDSAGITITTENKVTTHKSIGTVDSLIDKTKCLSIPGNIGIGHTRWATHGVVNELNAHPHSSNNDNLYIVHNGIIENYDTLRQELENRGYTFYSQTDTEVLINLIQDIQTHENIPLLQAVRLALKEVVGAYAIVIMDKNNTDNLIAVNKSSALSIGIGKDEFYISSTVLAMDNQIKKVIHLQDDQIASISSNGISILDMDNIPQTTYIEKLDLNLYKIEKDNYPHFMLKEIYEQPKSIHDCMRGRIVPNNFTLNLDGISSHIDKLSNARRIIIVGCGTSWHAGLVAEYIMESLTRIPVEVEYASEFRYRDPILDKQDVIIAISQSGETADTIAAIKLAKEKGVTVFGICNVVGSSIARITDTGLYTHAGPEIGVASTKAFTAQVVVLVMMSIKISYRLNKIDEIKYKQLLQNLYNIPNKIEQILNQSKEQIIYISERFKNSANFLYLGRGPNFPIALEGALKLKEISYIHAEGYPAAEMKHGPLSLIDENMPVVIIATKDSSYEKLVNNLQEVKTRKGVVIAIISKGDKKVSALADHVIIIPEVDPLLLPLLTIIPLQLLSYHIAVKRGCNVDKPRNLAKSVTVE